MQHYEKLIAAFESQFLEFGFKLMESSRFGVRFQNQPVELALTFIDQFLEKSLFVKIENETSIEINERFLETTFDMKTEIYHSQIEGFIENLRRFFNSEIGQLILKKDKSTLQKLRDGFRKTVREYSQNLLFEQDVKELQAAWQQEDFQKFVEKFEEMDSSQLRSSLKMKYQIALNRLKRKSPV